MNILILSLIRSLLLVTGVSLALGVGIGLLFSSWISGVIAFILTTIAQISINNMIIGVSNKKNKEVEILAQQVLREASERRLPYTLRCAYCSEVNTIGISFVSDNTFVCDKCKQPNKVYIQFTTARVTIPLIQKGYENSVIDDETDTSVSQTTVNQPIAMNEQ